MAQQTTPQEHPHTDPRNNEPSDQAPFSTEKGVNQQEYPGYVRSHSSDSIVTPILNMPLVTFALFGAFAQQMYLEGNAILI